MLSRYLFISYDKPSMLILDINNRETGYGAHGKKSVSSLSRVQLFSTPWTAARQTPLSMKLLQARILQWVDMPSSRGSSQPRDQTQVSRVAGGFFTIWATGEA